MDLTILQEGVSYQHKAACSQETQEAKWSQALGSQ